MSAIPIADLLNEAVCYACYAPGSVPELAKLALLSRIASAASTGMVITSLSSGFSTADTASYTTDTAFQPAPNTLLLAFIMSERGLSTQVAPVTVTGNGLTWVLVESLPNTIIERFRVTVYQSMGSAPTNDVLTVGYGATPIVIINHMIQVVQITNVNTSGTNGSGAVVQHLTAITGLANPTATLTAPVNTNGLNTIIGFAGCNGGNPFGATPESGWIELYDTGQLTLGACCVYQPNTLDNSVTLVKATTARTVIVAIEVKSVLS